MAWLSTWRKTRLLRDLGQLLSSGLSSAVNPLFASTCVRSPCPGSRLQTILSVRKHGSDLLACRCVYLGGFPPPRPHEAVACSGLGSAQLVLEGRNYLSLSTCGVLHKHGQLSELRSSPLSDVP